MALPALTLSLQFGELADAAVHRAALPRHWVVRCIRHALDADAEITVRIVDAEEGQGAQPRLPRPRLRHQRAHL